MRDHPSRQATSAWSTRTLGELEEDGILTLKNGFSSGTHELNGPGIPHIRPFNITDDGRVSLAQLKTIPPRVGLDEYVLHPGDVIYNNTNSEELVGKCGCWSDKPVSAVFSNHMTRIRVARPEALSARFLAFFLHHFWSSRSARLICRRHVNQASIGLERLRAIDVPHPSPTEQRAIAAVLARLQYAVEVQESIVAVLRELKAETMAKLFREGLRGEPLKQTEFGEIPESWEVVRLESICERMNYGTSTHCGRELIGRPVLRIPNVVNERIDTSDLKYANLAENHVEALALQAGDLLFVRTNGNRQYTGRCAVYMGEPKGALFASYLIRVRLVKETVLSEFCQSYLSSVGRQQITTRANPAADGKYNIDTRILKSLLLPRPAVVEQRSIVQALGTIERRLREAEKRLRTNRQLFSSMLGLLMSGHVRVTARMMALAGRRARLERTKKSGVPDEGLVEEIVRRIVEAVAPEKIILFGSAARGEMGPDSDIDVLVVKACDAPREVERRIYRRLIGIGIPKDIVVVTPGHLEKHKDTIGYIYRSALREGRIIYAR